jgi:Ran GTPase-activating protein (RanGAP) involved in mRNA processing and transport
VDGKRIVEIFSDGDIKVQDLSAVIALADAIKDMRALLVANVMGNNIGKEQLSKLQVIMCSKPNLMSLCGIPDDATEAGLSGIGMDADDAIILASELPGKGALTRLDISRNKLVDDDGAPAGKAISDMLAVNSTLRELDVSGNAQFGGSKGGPSFAQALSVGITDNGTLMKFDISSNDIFVEGTKLFAEALRGNQSMTELNLSSNCITDRAGYGSCNDMSGVTALADVIPGMGALLVLSLKDNRLATKEGGRALAQALASNSTLKELDVSSNNWMQYGTFGDWMSDSGGFAQELAVGIKDNGAMTRLDARENNIDDEGKRALQQAGGSRWGT